MRIVSSFAWFVITLVASSRLARADFVVEGTKARGTVRIGSAEEAKKLRGVSQVVGDLIIQNYDGAELSAFSSLTMIEGSLIISTNSNLTTLLGLGSLERVYGIVWIFSNPKLADLGGLAKLQSAEQAFTITDNPALTKLLPAGIRIGEPIKKIKGSLTIKNNRSLPAAVAEDFRKKCTVGGLVEIGKNAP